MSYELGQVFELIGPGVVMPAIYDQVIVVDVRDGDHPKGLGKGLPSALAVPHDDGVSWQVSLEEAHPLDVVILCRELPHHGDEVWRRVW